MKYTKQIQLKKIHLLVMHRVGYFSCLYCCLANHHIV